MEYLEPRRINEKSRDIRQASGLETLFFFEIFGPIRTIKKTIFK